MIYIQKILYLFLYEHYSEHFIIQIIMEFKTTLEIVTKDIQDIEKLVGNFKNYSKIPNIELDLALSRLRNVYELLLMFKSDQPDVNIAPEDAKPAQPNEQKKKAVIPKADIPVTQEPVSQGAVKEIAVPEKVIEPIEKQPDKITKAADPVKPSEKRKSDEDIKYIHEKLGEQVVRKDLTAKLQGQSIKSIAGSLGINDKFLFIRELFSGNAEVFRQTMEELDNSHNFNEAYSILMDRFQWDMESEPVQMLLNLIRRKFITSGNE